MRFAWASLGDRWRWKPARGCCCCPLRRSGLLRRKRCWPPARVGPRQSRAWRGGCCAPCGGRGAGGAAGFPWRSQAAWIGVALARRHGLAVEAASTVAAGVFRADLYRTHLRAAGADLPSASAKLEGALDAPTAVATERGSLILPADRFFDARIFDPSLPVSLK